MTSPRLRHRTYDPDVEKVVPKDAIVLNPDSGVVWGFLKDHEVDSPGAPRCDALAQEIRKQMPSPKPARIAEPGLWGVVGASVESHGKERGRFVRDGQELSGHYWECLDWSGTYDWDYLIDPVLIRDGVVES